MKKFKTLFLIILVLVTHSASKSQTADEIISKYFTAVGGKENIKKIKSIYSEGIWGEYKIPFNEIIVNGVGYKMEMNVVDMKAILCYTNNTGQISGWALGTPEGPTGTPSTEPKIMTEDEYNLGKYSIYVGGRLSNYSAHGFKATYMGKYNGEHKIKLASKTDEIIYYFNASTNYLNKIDEKISQGSINTFGEETSLQVRRIYTFSDYRKTETGYIMPYTTSQIIQSLGGEMINVYTIQKVEINKNFDPSIFDVPKKN